MEFIEIKNCYKIYKNGVTALADGNLSISKGEFVFLIGPTASGKSSLLKLLYREEKPNKGEVYVGGVNVCKLRNSKVYKLRRKIGIVFQDFKLLPRLTVFENIAYALQVIEKEPEEVQKRVVRVLDLVGLSHKADSFPNELSGGEQQRIAIARAIANKPSILIADEPTGNLDPETAEGIMEIMERINNDGTTVVMATHNSYIVNEYKHRVIEIADGRIIRDQEGGEYELSLIHI